MGLFNKGEDAAVGIRRALKKRGIQAQISVYGGTVTATAENIFVNDTALNVFWSNKELTVEYLLGSKPGNYLPMQDHVRKYNECNPTYSRAEMCAPENATNPACYKMIVTGSIPALKVADKASEAESFLEMILEDIFDDCAQALKFAHLYLQISNMKL